MITSANQSTNTKFTQKNNLKWFRNGTIAEALPFQQYYICLYGSGGNCIEKMKIHKNQITPYYLLSHLSRQCQNPS